MPATVLEARFGLSTGVSLGMLARIADDGVPWLRWIDGRTTPAQVVSGLTREVLESAISSSSPVVVACPAESPIIIGILTSSVSAVSEAVEVVKKNPTHHHQLRLHSEVGIGLDQSSPELKVDGTRVVLTGQEEVTLRCGKASITLTKAGKVIIRGAYVLTRSSGVNRIKGGSVQIN